MGGGGVVGLAAVCVLVVFGVLAVVYRRRESTGLLGEAGDESSVHGITAAGEISREANCRGFLRWCVVRIELIEHDLASGIASPCSKK
jgi:hypothetical protein